MDNLLYSPEAADELAALEADAGRARLFDEVVNVLDAIEADPGDRRVRRFRYRNPPIWGVPVRAPGQDADWLVLWATTERGPQILYIGEAP